jgi:hypothetical protein|tara:strand:- start:188 stop:535 length:348 start_codon:yes stop_codon:yes gene_type:complete
MGNNLKVPKKNDKMSFLEDTTAVADSLRSKGKPHPFQLSLMDYLGDDLYGIFESGKVESDMPFGFKSRLDFRNQNLNFSKSFGDNYKFDFNINKKTPYGGHREDISLGITKKLNW